MIRHRTAGNPKFPDHLCFWVEVKLSASNKQSNKRGKISSWIEDIMQHSNLAYSFQKLDVSMQNKRWLNHGGAWDFTRLGGKKIPKKTFWTRAHNYNLNEGKCKFFPLNLLHFSRSFSRFRVFEVKKKGCGFWFSAFTMSYCSFDYLACQKKSPSVISKFHGCWLKSYFLEWGRLCSKVSIS